ncbi:PIN domain-containing protein [uncultured Herbaspirillum sp.]|uniref:PIN domain-containing protein n=1 Tax=uncultured Herbaspirillum sp. TaxID=160236 RepID=UPI0026073959|nr:PIN domain-containing protein [uncultured Herbaspirillum sp.]
MIVLDTNVVSEAMKPEIHPGVHAWLNAQVPQTLYLTSITIAEMGFGIASLPAARAHAELAVKARRAGRGFPTPDGYIAAIAASCDFSVASRDVSAYAAAALPVINPWEH